tara:strand:+ start:165 stop:347 length:183 start_codon:yes stop_codon:yes gene_type:complete
MSIDYSDVWELGAVSDCCNAGVYLNGICSCCNDHCTPVEEEEVSIMDVYRDVGMSPGDFI